MLYKYIRNVKESHTSHNIFILNNVDYQSADTMEINKSETIYRDIELETENEDIFKMENPPSQDSLLIHLHLSDQEIEKRCRLWNGYEFIQEWDDYFKEITDTPVEYIVTSGLFIISTIINNKCIIKVPHRTKEKLNYWPLHIGESDDTRKSYIFNKTLDFLKESMSDYVNLINGKATIRGLQNALQNQDRLVLMCNEGAGFFKDFNQEWAAGSVGSLCSFYDGTGYDYHKSETVIRIPEDLHFNFLVNAPTPSSDYIKEEFIKKGLIPKRFSPIYPIETRGELPPVGIPDDLEDDDMINSITLDDEKWEEMKKYSIDLLRMMITVTQNERIKLIPTKGASKLINDFYYKSKKNEKRKYLKKTIRKIQKIAGIKALINGIWTIKDNKIPIKEEDIKWAIDPIIKWEMDGMDRIMNDIDESPTQNEKEIIHRRNIIKNMVKKSGTKGISWNRLFNKLESNKGVNRTMMWDDAHSLIDSEEIIICEENTQGKPGRKKLMVWAYKYKDTDIIDPLKWTIKGKK